MHSNNLLSFNAGFIRRKLFSLLCAYKCAHKVEAGLDNARKSRGAMKRSCCLRLFRGKQMVAASGIKPQSVVRPLTYYFRLLPSLPVHLSFACRHLACLILSA